MKRLVASIFTFLVVLSGPASAGEIRLLASGAVQDVLSKVLPDFERSSPHKVNVTWAGAAVYRPLLSSDAAFDAVVISSTDADSFIESKKLRASKVNLSKTGIGIGVRKGQPRPDIGNTESVKALLLKARSIAYSMGPSGAYVEKLIAKLGIADEVRPKLKQTKTGREVGNLIASGEAEIGFQPISELVHADGVDFVGGLPSEIQSFTIYSFVTHSQVKDEKAVQELRDFLRSPSVQAVFQKAGMELP